MVKAKIPTTEMDYFGSGGSANEFQYVSSDGGMYLGQKGIEKMSQDFPRIQEYMWMLPANYRTMGLKAAYKVGSVVRNVVRKVTGKGCSSCGRR
jgi:uncharacterized protein YneF (UPF0154 family)